MDFERLVSCHKSRTCVISVEHYPDGTYGNIRIVTANKPHIDDVEQTFHRSFVPDSPYHYYLPQDKNFEDFMYRSACLGEPLHTYVHLEQMGLWVNMFLMPLDSDEENLGYCFYYYDITPYVDREQQASLAADTASNTLEICIKLRGAERENKVEVFSEVIEDLRKQSCAEYSCILLVDDEKQEYDAIISSYHDQGLCPVKALCFDEVVNTTIGLKVVRTSPPTGTAYDIAGKNIANPKGMVSAISLLLKLI